MTNQPLTALRLRTTGPEETQTLAATLATVLRDGDLLILAGDLGAGKTCFAQGLGRGLGVEDRMTSPTFTLANRYRGRLTLNHLDVYRLESLAETADLGLSELLEDGVTVIEWGDRIAEVVPNDHLLVALRYSEPVGPDGRTGQGVVRAVTTAGDGEADNEREIDISSPGDRSGRWADRDLPGLLSPWAAA